MISRKGTSHKNFLATGSLRLLTPTTHAMINLVLKVIPTTTQPKIDPTVAIKNNKLIAVPWVKMSPK
jgi:hypothetical protein